MDAKLCDKCGKVLDELDSYRDVDSIETDWVEINAKLLKPDNDYCVRCQYVMRAEAGRLYWDNYKQQRKAKNAKSEKTKTIKAGQAA